MNKDVFGRDLTALKAKKLFLLDQDGTLYLHDDLFAATKPFLSTITNNGSKYLFITNNTSKSTADYVAKLAKLGIASTSEDFFTAGDATIIYLQKHHKGKRVFVVGTSSFIRSLTEAGIVVTNAADAEVALLAYDTELNYEKLKALSWLLTKRNVPYIATNPDLVCPINFGFVPDCGSFAIMIEKATGKTPIFIGKPEKTMVEMLIAQLRYAKDDCVIIGDRTYTDIQAGINAGITSVCVLSGEATLSDIAKMKVKPDYVVNSIADLIY